MSSTHISQAKSQLETIFAKTNIRLEQLIARYQAILRKDPIDPLQDRIIAFCEKLESLKNKINDTDLGPVERVKSVGLVADCVDDLSKDLAKFTKNNDEMQSSKLIYIIDEIESAIGVDTGPELSMAETDMFENPGLVDKYFKAKKAELDKILNEHPDLTKAN
jgi:hypothetical protein